ncbi:MAG TPA: alpha/beta fold hydrolase [Actinocatenispora sp.]
MTPVETRHLTRGRDRLALRVHPTTGGRTALLLPAMGVPAAYYDGFAAQLTAGGLDVVVADLRGTGASAPLPTRASRHGYAELVDDVAAVLAELGTDAPLLIGHSLGGHAAALHLALGGSGAGLALIASGTPWKRYYPGWSGVGLRAVTPVITGLSAGLGYWPGHRLGFGGRQSRGIMRDWAYVVRTGDFPALDGIDVDARLADVKVPVLGVSVEGDRLTPAPTLDHFTDKFTGTAVTRHHYTTAESGAPMNHFRWTRAAAPLIARILAFADAL